MLPKVTGILPVLKVQLGACSGVVTPLFGSALHTQGALGDHQLGKFGAGEAGGRSEQR